MGWKTIEAVNFGNEWVDVISYVTDSNGDFTSFNYRETDKSRTYTVTATWSKLDQAYVYPKDGKYYIAVKGKINKNNYLTYKTYQYRDSIDG